MKTVTVSDERRLRDVIGKGVKRDVLVERNGRAIALIVPFDDDDRYWYARERDPAFVKSISKARKHIREGKSISHEELKVKLGLK
jgi:hypothetical protein